MRPRPWFLSSVRVGTVLALVGAAVASARVRAEVTLYAAGRISGTATDLSGLGVGPNKQHPANQLGSFGSAMRYTGKDDLYWAVNDRGPADGEVEYRCRMHQMKLTFSAPTSGVPGKVVCELVKTVLLSDQRGQGLVGQTSAFDPKDPSPTAEKTLRFDPEGLALGPAGTLFISDEYGPLVDEFSVEGKRLRHLPVPARFSIDKPSQNAGEEEPLTKGRIPNRGFEGLEITPDATELWAILQSPLMQDIGEVGSDGKRKLKKERIGTNIRTLRMGLDGVRKGEYVYALDDATMGVNDLLAVDGKRFLVIERDGRAGDHSRGKRIMLADFSKATDVSAIERLPASKLPPEIVPARKREFIDLLNPAWKIDLAHMPEKIEALTWGPKLPDGRRSLVVVSDNDLRADQDTFVWVFAVSEADLAAEATPAPTH